MAGTTTATTEFELIAKLRERLARGAAASGPAEIVAGSGDDAAITVPPGATATSVDLAVEGVHFRRQTATPRAIGHKALAAALSDLAAMGAAPGEAYVQLGLPEGFTESECLELADGVAGVAAFSGVTVLGGDLSRASVLIVAVTVVGHAPAADALVTRAGAAAGDELFVTGELGGAAAGLLLLERPELAAGLPDELARGLRARQLEPVPRLAAGRALAEAGASAMIDVSDGIAGDAGHLATASGVRAEIEAELLPLAPGVGDVARAAGRDPLELAASGGEDYELLVALPAESAERAAAAGGAAGVTLRRVGRVVSGSGVSIRGRNGELEARGFDQLHGPPPSDPGAPA